MSEQVREKRFTVVVNHEEQYSIWPVGTTLPQGWDEVGVTGDRQTCLDHIDQVWTDMRPLSLRRHMAAEGAGA
jgi:MbtH protein